MSSARAWRGTGCPLASRKSSSTTGGTSRSGRGGASSRFSAGDQGFDPNIRGLLIPRLRARTASGYARDDASGLPEASDEVVGPELLAGGDLVLAEVGHPGLPQHLLVDQELAGQLPAGPRQDPVRRVRQDL